MDTLFRYFNDFVKLSPESQEIIASRLEIEEKRKGHYLWKAGQRCTSLYFNVNGILRLFFYDEHGAENTVHFAGKEKFIADLESLNSSVPSSISCIASTDCTLIMFSQSALSYFAKEVFEWHELVKKITEKTLFEKIRLRDQLFQKEAKERYLWFNEQFPFVAVNVQASHIASYLGISQYTLSHLKKELSKSRQILRNSKN